MNANLLQEELARQHEVLHDLGDGYPANHFAFQRIAGALIDAGATSILEVGVGRGNALPLLVGLGLQVSAIDTSDEAVEASRQRLSALGKDAGHVIRADIEDPITYAPLVAGGRFDALVSLGVLPHVRHERQTLLNMRSLVRPGGEVFVEFRNKLFSLFTFNRYTYDFIMDDLLGDVDESLRSAVGERLRGRLDMEVPPVSTGGHAARFHNPFEVIDEFTAAGFSEVEAWPFHYHAGPPVFEASHPRAFRDESIALEHETSGWKGLFLCSAFIIRARRPLEQDPVH
jgi:SAM-dependent methyltransferase